MVEPGGSWYDTAHFGDEGLRGVTDLGIIDLAHAPDFRLGSVCVRPSRRQLVHDSGRSEVLQPRVMQVLVALAKAGGEIVTREELSQSCWDGRIVGEDAINRVISHLRRSAQRVGAGAFGVETVTKVGYRLQRDAAAAARPSDRATGIPTERPRLSRRAVAAAAVGAVAAASLGVWVWTRRADSGPPPSPAAEALLQQAMAVMLQDNREGANQAIGLLQRLTADYPRYADGWGILGYTYAVAARCSPAAEAGPLRDRARHAVEQARALRRDCIDADVAEAVFPPRRGAWLASERQLRSALARRPGDIYGLLALGEIMCEVGRHARAAAILEGLRPRIPPNPGLYFSEILALEGSGQLEAADRLIDEATRVYPTQFAVWFTRVYELMYTGRASTAVGIVEDISGRPTGIPSGNFDIVLAMVRSMVSRDPAQVERVMAQFLALAHLGNGHAENAIQYASAVGRLDDAFAVAAAYFFDEGFVVPELRFTPEQGSYMTLADRQTAFLFYPSTANMRADPRFNALAERLGLARYWRESGSQPDYLRRA